MAGFERISTLSRRDYWLSLGRRFLHEDSGQTLVEYVLLMGVTIGILVLLKNSISSFTAKMWRLLGRRIAAPCHDLTKCIAGSEFDI